VQDQSTLEKDRRNEQDEEFKLFASKVMHKETRTRYRAEKSEFSARKELYEAEEEI